MRALAIALLLAAPAAAQDTSITRQDGLEAWDRIFAVTAHPRCTNCHVGDTGQAMWDGLGYGADTVHGKVCGLLLGL